MKQKNKKNKLKKSDEATLITWPEPDPKKMTLRMNMSASFKGGIVFCSLKWSLKTTSHDVNKKLSLGVTRKLFTCRWILSKSFYPFDPRLNNKGHKQDDVWDPSILQSLAEILPAGAKFISQRTVSLCVLTHSVVSDALWPREHCWPSSCPSSSLSVIASII